MVLRNCKLKGGGGGFGGGGLGGGGCVPDPLDGNVGTNALLIAIGRDGMNRTVAHNDVAVHPSLDP